MANHSYVTLREKLSADEADQVLAEVVSATFGDLFRVARREDLEPMWQNARVWEVHIPGSCPVGNPMQPEDYGFLVFYHRRMWEFRHPINMWERWCQSKVKYRLAERFGAKILDDADDKVHTVADKDVQEVLQHATFAAFLSRNFKRPLKEADRVWLQDLLDAYAPPEFRTLE